MAFCDDSALRERLCRVAETWAEAEEALKITEQVLSEAMIPAVMELRYAGRKVTKALSNYLADAGSVEADRLLDDAVFDCLRARHDATDAATAKISLDLDAAIHRLGADAVRRDFSDYSKLRGKLANVRKKIAMTRGDADQRNETYDALEKHELPEIMELYEEFLAAEPSMKNRRVQKFVLDQGVNFGWLIALIVTVWVAFK